MRNMMSAALIAAGALLGWSSGAVAAADSACTSLGGEFPDEQTCHVHASSSTYMLDMTFPPESGRIRQCCADVVADFRPARCAVPDGSHL
jgi:hypothetical protein